MYKILGGDHKEYGPVAAEQLITWINEGRANGSTLAQAEGSSEWKPLSTFSEFAEPLRGKAVPPPVSPPPAAPAPGAAPVPSPPVASQVLARDYHLDIGECISRAWNLYKENFGLLFGVSAIFLLIEAFVGGLSCIPLVGPVFSIANLFIAGPLVVGIYTVFLRRFRGQPGKIDDLFSGVSSRYGQYLLGYIVPVLLSWLSAIPGAILLGIGFAIRHNVMPLAVIFWVVGAILILVALIYFGVSWIFTLPLVLDKGFDFWQAMEVSRKMVGKHFASVLGLLIVTSLINLVGLLFCGIGLFFTLPICFGALAYAYLTLFGDQPAAATPPGNAPLGSPIPPTPQA